MCNSNSLLSNNISMTNSSINDPNSLIDNPNMSYFNNSFSSSNNNSGAFEDEWDSNLDETIPLIKPIPKDVKTKNKRRILSILNSIFTKSSKKDNENILKKFGIKKEILDKTAKLPNKLLLMEKTHLYLSKLNKDDLENQIFNINKIKDLEIFFKAREASTDLYKLSFTQILNLLKKEKSLFFQKITHTVIEANKIQNERKTSSSINSALYLTHENVIHSFLLQKDGGIIIKKKTIDKGGFKEVFESYNILNGKTDQVIIKIFNQDNSTFRKMTEKELNILRDLSEKKSPYIIPDYLEIARMKKLTVGIQSFKTPLNDLINEFIPVRIWAKIIAQIGVGIAGMHQNGYIHGDVKLSNCLIESDYKKVYLIDFGFSIKISKKNSKEKALGYTPTYASPESITGDHLISTLSDSFSFGVLILRIVIHLMNIEHIYKIKDLCKNKSYDQMRIDRMIIDLIAILTKKNFNDTDKNLLLGLLIITLDLLKISPEKIFNSEQELLYLKEKSNLLNDLIKELSNIDISFWNNLQQINRIEFEENDVKEVTLVRISCLEASKQLKNLFKKLNLDIEQEVDWSILGKE